MATFKQKLQKEIPQFTTAIDSMSVEELEKEIARYAKYMEETNEAKENDAELNETKEAVAELSAPYSDAVKIIKKKIKYIYLSLKETNGAPTE